MTLRTFSRSLPLLLALLSLACGDDTVGLGPRGVKLSFAESTPLQLGSARTYTLKVERKGGLEGALDLSLGEPSLGFTFAPLHLSAADSEASLTVAISDGPAPGSAGVPFLVRGAGESWDVSVPVQLVAVPEGIAPQVQIAQRSVVRGGEVDVPVHVDRTNGFTMGFYVDISDAPGVIDGLSPAYFGYQTADAALRVRVAASVEPGVHAIPYVVGYGGGYGSQPKVVEGSFPLEVTAD